MNYIEWALERSETLWSAWEETMKKRMAEAATRAARTNRMTENGEASAREEKAEESGMAATADTAMVRNAYAQAADTEETERTEGGAPEGMTARIRPTPEAAARNRETARYGAMRKTESGSAWIARSLMRDGTEGALAAAARERNEGKRAIGTQAAETTDAEMLSLGLERDARRYDGGFTMY